MPNNRGIARPPMFRPPRETRVIPTAKEIDALRTMYELGKTDDSLTYKKIGDALGVNGSSIMHRCVVLRRLGLMEINPVRATEAGRLYVEGLP